MKLSELAKTLERHTPSPAITTPLSASTWGAAFDAPNAPPPDKRTTELAPPATPTNTSYPERLEMESIKQRAEDAEIGLLEVVQQSKVQLAEAEARNAKLTAELAEALSDVEEIRADRAELEAGRETIAELENAAVIEANWLTDAWKNLATGPATVIACPRLVAALTRIATLEAELVTARERDRREAEQREEEYAAYLAEHREEEAAAIVDAPAPPAPPAKRSLVELFGAVRRPVASQPRPAASSPAARNGTPPEPRPAPPATPPHPLVDPHAKTLEGLRRADASANADAWAAWGAKHPRSAVQQREQATAHKLALERIGLREGPEPSEPELVGANEEDIPF